MIKKRYLLLIASIVWFAAGLNIFLIGLFSYRDNFTYLHLLYTVIVFIIFYFLIFSKIVNKHTKRIKGYKEEKQLFIKFFDVPSFIIMAFMMTFGILLRSLKLAPIWFIAFFYTGLGFALLLAGIKFFIKFIKYNKE